MKPMIMGAMTSDARRAQGVSVRASSRWWRASSADTRSDLRRAMIPGGLARASESTCRGYTLPTLHEPARHRMVSFDDPAADAASENGTSRERELFRDVGVLVVEDDFIVAFDMQFFTNKDVPDNIVYNVTKVLHENKQALVQSFRPMVMFNPDKMAKPLKDVPFHPGAEKYYKEIGLLK